MLMCCRERVVPLSPAVSAAEDGTTWGVAVGTSVFPWAQWDR